MTKETIKQAIVDLACSKYIKQREWEELKYYLSQHPVMQEGKEDKIDRFPVTDEIE